MKRLKLNKIRIWIFLTFLLLVGVNLQAQPPMKASSLNVFTNLNTTTTIDVIAKSELSGCGAINTLVDVFPTVSSLLAPQHGTISVNGNREIVYTPNSGFVGQDSLQYRLTCSINTSDAVIYINVEDKPGNIIDDACSIDRKPIRWGIDTSWSSDQEVSAWVIPLVGDLTGDGIPEIMCFGSLGQVANPQPYTVSTILVYDGLSHAKLRTIDLRPLQVNAWDGASYGLVRIPDGNNNSRGLIIVGFRDFKLRAYDINQPAGSELVWTSDFDYGSEAGDFAFNMGFADFNNDGYPEVYVRNKIYDAATGHFLKTATGGSNTGSSWGHVPSTSNWKSSSPAAADVLGDRKLELILGNEIYQVNIDRTKFGPDTTYNSITLAQTIAPPTGIVDAYATGIIADGHTQVADFNMDGYLDVFISNREKQGGGGYVSAYIWDVHNNQVSNPLQIPQIGNNQFAGKSFPLIADVNDNGLLDIVIQSQTNLASGKIRAYEYDFSADTFNFLWGINPNEDSWSNGCVLFDFDQDGESEVLVSDQEYISIINGKTGAVKVKLEFGETTVMQNPIIADFDGDGAAEIVATGLVGSGNLTHVVKLNIFKSEFEPWAPARPVWNQIMYNVVNVNDDLTIPQYQLNPATFFLTKEGEYHQPFNNCLQQATLLNEDGKPLSYGPNLEFNLPSLITTPAEPNLDVEFNVYNTGDKLFTGPLKIAAYLWTGTSYKFLETWNVPGNIAVGDNPTITHTITGFTGNPINLQIRLNDDGTGFQEPECNYSTNFSSEIFGAPDYRLCAGEPEDIRFYPDNLPVYTYYWYLEDPATGATSVYDGNPYPFTKGTTSVSETLYVKVFNGSVFYPETYEVKTYLVPDSLVWNGSADSDWNNAENWTYRSNDYTCVDCAQHRFPGYCTNVEIPAGRSFYPDLTPISTNYTRELYEQASCNHIWFEHGGEVVRTDSLHYTEAYVDLQVKSNQWYMLSAPLQNMYTGDFYANSPNPFLDGDGTGLFIEPMFFNVANPETHKYTEYKWTGTFNNADVEFRSGEGLALWAGDKYDYDHHDNHTFSFPKSDTYYKYYYTNGTETGRVTPTLNRTNKNRFIYEPTINKTAGATYGNVPLYTPPVTAAGEPILVGNPFMAHLLFNDFVTLNSADIVDEYKLAFDIPVGVANNGKVNDFVTYKVVGGAPINTSWDPGAHTGSLTNDIAPMQSFVVISKNATPQLKANIKQTETVAGVKLRSASSTNTPDYLLEITSEQNQQPTSKALLLYIDNASNDYVPAEDSYKLFSENSLAHVLVYLRSSDGYALDINSIGNLEQAIPLGIRTNQKGQIRLKFEGTDKFLDKANVFLHDTKANKVTNMSLYKEYTFNKDEDDLYLENRFYITFNNGSPTGIKGLESASVSIQNPAPQTLQILSNADNPLGHVQITDLQGKILVSKDVQATSYIYPVKIPGLYIVRVTRKESVEVKKVIIK